MMYLLIVYLSVGSHHPSRISTAFPSMSSQLPRPTKRVDTEVNQDGISRDEKIAGYSCPHVPTPHRKQRICIQVPMKYCFAGYIPQVLQR